MKHLFVPYEIARQLKEKGFDEPCIVCYDCYDESQTFKLYPLVNWHNIEGVNPSDVKHTVCAPLYQQVIDWFREKHNITVSVIGYYYPHLGKHFYLTRVNEKENGENWGYIESYYEALDKAIEEALKLNLDFS